MNIRGVGSMDRIWFMLRVIHNSKNNTQHFNTIYDWLFKLYGNDGLFDIGPKVISDEEFTYFHGETTIAFERYRKRETKRRLGQAPCEN